MYVLDAWDTQDYAGWRANLDAVNEFYFTDWSDSYAEAFGDRSARGVIAVAVYREVPPPPAGLPALPRKTSAAPARPMRHRAVRRQPRARTPPRKSPQVAAVTPRARVTASGASITPCRWNSLRSQSPDSRHFIKYEWRETLCRKHVMECGESNRFWDESTLGFAPPPPGRR